MKDFTNAEFTNYLAYSINTTEKVFYNSDSSFVIY